MDIFIAYWHITKRGQVFNSGTTLPLRNTNAKDLLYQCGLNSPPNGILGYVHIDCEQVAIMCEILFSLLDSMQPSMPTIGWQCSETLYKKCRAN